MEIFVSNILKALDIMLQYLKEGEYLEILPPIIPYSIFSINLKMLPKYFAKKSQGYIEN